jgi:hypothetical protein
MWGGNQNHRYLPDRRRSRRADKDLLTFPQFIVDREYTSDGNPWKP